MPNSTNRVGPFDHPSSTGNGRVTRPGLSATPAPISGVLADGRVLQLPPGTGTISVAPGDQIILALNVYNPTSIMENFRFEVTLRATDKEVSAPDDPEDQPSETFTAEEAELKAPVADNCPGGKEVPR